MQGYMEVSHTADWAVRVWADELTGLFAEAADAMTALMGVKVGDLSPQNRILHLEAEDTESLLVAYLSELLFIMESERRAAIRQDLKVEARTLRGEVWFQPVQSLEKEIKAVTFSGLKIITTPQGYQVEIVFDV